MVDHSCWWCLKGVLKDAWKVLICCERRTFGLKIGINSSKLGLQCTVTILWLARNTVSAYIFLGLKSPLKTTNTFLYCLTFRQHSKGITQTRPIDYEDPRILGYPGYDDFEAGTAGTFGLAPNRDFPWKSLHGFYIHLIGSGTYPDGKIYHIKFVGNTSFGEKIISYD